MLLPDIMAAYITDLNYTKCTYKYALFLATTHQTSSESKKPLVKHAFEYITGRGAVEFCYTCRDFMYETLLNYVLAVLFRHDGTSFCVLDGSQALMCFSMCLGAIH